MNNMEFWNEGVNLLQTIVTGIGAVFIVLGLISLMEGYGGDNAASKSQGIKQFAAGAGIVLVGMVLVPQLSGIF